MRGQGAGGGVQISGSNDSISSSTNNSGRSSSSKQQQAAAIVAAVAVAAAAAAAAITTATAILSVTRNSEVVGSTSDEATGVLTWLLRTCPTAHSDCSKLGDEKYVTGKCPSWRIITIAGRGPARAPRAPRRSRARDGETVARRRRSPFAPLAFARGPRDAYARFILVCWRSTRDPPRKYGGPPDGREERDRRASTYAPDGRHESSRGSRAMESMVEENGSAVDPLSQGSQSGDAAPAIATSVQSIDRTHQQQTHHLVASTSIVQLTLPSSGTTQVQSVIQPNQQSVIQTATNIQPVAISKGNVILVSKPNSVIQTAQGSLQTLQVVETGSDDSFSDEDSPKKRNILTRRPSYRKILNDLGGGEITDGRLPPLESSSECDSNVDSEVSSHSLHYQTVIPAGTIQIATQGEGVPGLHTLTMSNAATAGGAIVQYAQGQDTQFFVPAYTGHGVVVEDAARKRELRLLKNREAARECRRKKKEYIKCLENRVAVLENRNQTLIDELKSLKELYQQKTD